MTTARILYLVYGPDAALRTQAQYSMLSALAWSPGGVSVHVFTDAPDAWDGLGGSVQVEGLAAFPASASAFERKLLVLEHAAARWPESPLLFCDADTFFVARYGRLLEQLACGGFALHRREYGIEEQPGGQMRKFRRALARAGVEFSGASMWNSGVVGLPAGRGDVVARAKALFQRIRAHTLKQYLAEQFAITTAICEQQMPLAAEDFVFHYWFQKADYTLAIEGRTEAWSGVALEPQMEELRSRPLSLPMPTMKTHWWERAAAVDPRGRPPVI